MERGLRVGRTTPLDGRHGQCNRRLALKSAWLSDAANRERCWVVGVGDHNAPRLLREDGRQDGIHELHVQTRPFSRP